jgi:hypothetical protein
MAEQQAPATERTAMTELRDEALAFFDAVEKEQPRREAVQEVALDEYSPDENSPIVWGRGDVQEIPPRMSDELEKQSEGFARRIRLLMVNVSAAARRSALLGDADLGDLSINAKAMAAAVRFRRYRYRELYIHHDEGTVLGVSPPSQDEDERISIDKARRIFSTACEKIFEIIDLISPSGIATPTVGESSRYTPDTAFIMMQIDKGNPELDDVLDTVAEVFGLFDIKARRADEIEHDDVITNRILSEIETCEFLFADLSGERPSVYYEVGYAHALKKRVILYRRKGTRIHFDLAHRNCPEYANMRELRQLLTRRLKDMTGKEPKAAKAAEAIPVVEVVPAPSKR